MNKSKEFIKELREKMKPKEQESSPGGGEKVGKIYVDDISNEVLSSNVTYQELVEAGTDNPLIIYIYRIATYESSQSVSYYPAQAISLIDNGDITVMYMPDKSSAVIFSTDGQINNYDVG